MRNRKVYNYKRIRSNWGQKILVHRKIMEDQIGRSLGYDEVVHHKDGNIQNNDLNNLEIISRSRHSSLHNSGTTKSRNIDNKCKQGHELDRIWVRSNGTIMRICSTCKKERGKW